MGAYKDLAIELHNQQIRRPLRLAIYDRPGTVIDLAGMLPEGQYLDSQTFETRTHPIDAQFMVNDRPNAGDHITNAIDHLEMFILPDVTDRLSYDYIVSQLRKAIAMIEGEQQ